MYILLTSVSLFNNQLGSWTTEFQKFIRRNPGFFTYILSPDTKGNGVLTSVKKKFLTRRFFKAKQLTALVARDYIRHLTEIKSKHPDEPLKTVIIDDFSLVKAIALWKKVNRVNNLSVVYFFHGHLLTGDPAIFPYTDKVLFLTEAGYLDTLHHHFSFPPEVEVVGNGVDSEIFYPLSPEEKKKKRQQLNLPVRKKVITWLANDRPSKGLHIFEKIIPQLNRLYDDLHFVIIGSRRNISLPNVTNIGRIPNQEVASYLQASDYYFHTALVREGFGLTLVEALKTGNIVLASALGGIPEVTACCPDRTMLIDKPNMTGAWIAVFQSVYTKSFTPLSKEEARKIWNYLDWEKRFIKALQ